MSQQGFEVDIIWETEAIRFSKQVEDEIRKNGSAQPENSTVKNPENPNAEEPKNKDSNISKNKENLRENSTVKNPTAEEPKTEDQQILPVGRKILSASFSINVPITNYKGCVRLSVCPLNWIGRREERDSLLAVIYCVHRREKQPLGCFDSRNLY